ncbi:hypothetical protein LINGRAHAP2_LOCUS31420 [Linum grandiflorum]
MGRSGTFYCSSAIVAEARALLEGLSFATEPGASCHVFSDCKTLVDAIHGPQVDWPWSCYGLLGSIKAIVSSVSTISIRFIPRGDNMRADSAAKAARIGPLPRVGSVQSCNRSRRTVLMKFSSIVKKKVPNWCNGVPYLFLFVSVNMEVGTAKLCFHQCSFV